MCCIFINPEGLHVYRKCVSKKYTTPVESNQSLINFFYKHLMPLASVNIYYVPNSMILLNLLPDMDYFQIMNRTLIV